MTPWQFESRDVLVTPEGMAGFTYVIENLITNQKYIGRKFFEPEKAWRNYWSSSEPLKADLKKYGKAAFTRRMLEMFLTRDEVIAGEIAEQESRDVLNATFSYGGMKYYNLNIGGAKFSSHRDSPKTPEEIEEDRLRRNEYARIFYINNTKQIAERDRKYREANKEKIALRQKAYGLKNKEKISQKRKKNRPETLKREQKYHAEHPETRANWLKKNKEKIAAQQKAYNLKHKDKLDAYKKQYQIDNKEHLAELSHQNYIKNKESITKRHKAWFKNNPEKSRAYSLKYYHKQQELKKKGTK